jgi:hypothetical protein
MEKVKEYSDPKNQISYAYAVTRVHVNKMSIKSVKTQNNTWNIWKKHTIYSKMEK